MSVSRAVLIGFQDQGNLGLGYLAATLEQHGFAVRMLDFREGHPSLLKAVRSAEPALVGFSLIFQYYLPQFAELIAYLRANGVACHFCAGGHFPTLRYQEVFNAAPGLDSIARGEGELTLLELMRRVVASLGYSDIPGLVSRSGRQIVAGPPRPLIADLDQLPFPIRPFQDLRILGKRVVPVLASRGCARHCSFCSIRQFYDQMPGRRVRIRKAACVAQEMRQLHEDQNVSVFLFQDDDFPVWGEFGRRWIGEFIQALEHNGLVGRIIWKISCRADQVERTLFSQMRDAGLYMVYLGLESGNEKGLQTLHKGLRVDDNLNAVALLKELRLLLGYGFMLFDPSSTVEALQRNLVFLRKICGDGSAATVFCRMLPYAGTPIEQELLDQGRLRGDVVNPDYSFLDHRVTTIFESVHARTHSWIQDRDGLAQNLNWAWQEYWVCRRLFRNLAGLDEYEQRLRSITQQSNQFLLNLVECLCLGSGNGFGDAPTPSEVELASQDFSARVIAQRNAFVLGNQSGMLAELGIAA